MTKSPAEIEREQRLAAKLRENLKRRKAQAKARAAGADATTAADSSPAPSMPPHADKP